MTKTNADYQNLNTTARIVVGTLGVAMLAAFYVATIGGATLGAGVYLGILSIVPITMAIIGWSPIVSASYEQHERLPSPAH